MRRVYSERFQKSFDEAPKAVQRACDKQLSLLLQNLHHPSLHAKKYSESEDLWQARVNKDWRFYFFIQDDIYYLVGRQAPPQEVIPVPPQPRFSTLACVNAPGSPIAAHPGRASRTRPRLRRQSARLRELYKMAAPLRVSRHGRISRSMRSSRLYLAMRSELRTDPTLICPAPEATARSARNESSVSPDRAEITAR